MLTAVALIDYVTGYEFMFHTFYFIPVIYVAGKSKKRATIMSALFAAVTWWLVDRLNGHNYSREILRYWNAFTCFVSFLCVGLLVLQLREALAASERATANAKENLASLQESTAQLRELEGSFKVVCAWTHQIKDEGGWIPIEDFLAKRLHLSLTHGISPEGLKKMLGPE